MFRQAEETRCAFRISDTGHVLGGSTVRVAVFPTLLSQRTARPTMFQQQGDFQVQSLPLRELSSRSLDGIKNPFQNSTSALSQKTPGTFTFAGNPPITCSPPTRKFFRGFQPTG